MSSISSQRRGQSGVTLIGFILFAGLLALIGIEAMRSYPLFLEYFEVQRALTRSADSANNPIEIRKAFDKYASINNITSITGSEIMIDKTPAGLVASTAYYGWAYLFKDVYVVIQFRASSRPMKEEADS